MAFNYEYPYVDPNRHNNDWELAEVKRVSNEMKTLKDWLADNLNELVREVIERMFFRAEYDEDTETINMYSITPGQGEGELIIYYDEDTQRIVIRREEGM